MKTRPPDPLAPWLTDPSGRADARAAAEAGGDDAALLRWRELELADAELPPVLDGARRTRLLCADALATTWEGWDLASGRRLLLRCVRPRWRRDAVMLRRLARAQRALDPPHWLPDGDWPHLRAEAPGALILDRLPAEDPPDTGFLARVLAGGLRGLDQLHGAGITHGGPLLAHLCEPAAPHAPATLLWLGAFGAEGGPARDLADLGAAVAALDPDGDDPVGQLAATWATEPPPSADDGLALLQRTLSAALTDRRHRLSVAARHARRRQAAGRLLRAVTALAEALPPPPGRFCLRAESDGPVDLALSADGVIRGGAALRPPEGPLPVIYSPAAGLDAQAARHLMRAWARRQSGDEALRQRVQAWLGGTDDGAAALVRWMSGMARLRAARLLLDHER